MPATSLFPAPSVSASPPSSRVEVSCRTRPDSGPNHHLWRNGRLWWIAYTVIYDGWRQERVRQSLRTADVHEARRRRDAILAGFALDGSRVA